MNDPKEKAKETIRENRSWVEKFGRLGYAARGVVYLLIGILAVQAATGIQKANSGSRSALEQITELPFGQILLAIVTIGLICHALWRLVQAFMDTDNKGSDTKGILARSAFVVISLIYFGLAFSAVKILLGTDDQSGSQASSWTAWLLSQPFGQLLVGIIGAIIVGVGLYQFYQAYTAKFRENLLLSEMSETIEKWGERLGRFGYSARGVVFSVIGGFLIFAAWRSNAGKTRDFGDALHFVEKQSYGIWLLGIVAFGLIAYGLFMFFLAKYRKMLST